MKLFGRNSNDDVRIRKYHPSDKPSVYDVYLKTYADGWSVQHWNSILSDRKRLVYVAIVHGKIVGFILLRRWSLAVEVEKVAVLREYRNNCAGVQLMYAGVQLAVDNDVKYIFTVLPEYRVYPGSDNVSGWLSLLGFKAKKPFIKDYCRVDGKSEDGVRFEYAVGNRGVNAAA